MSGDVTVEQLELELTSNADGTVSSLDALASTLNKIRGSVKGGLGLTSAAKQLKLASEAAKGFDLQSVTNLRGFAEAIEVIANAPKVKLQNSLPSQLTNIGGAVKSLSGIDFSPLTELYASLGMLADIKDISVGSALNQLKRVPEVAAALKNVDLSGFKEQISGVAEAVAPLSVLDKNKLTSYITQLGKIPDIVKNLDDEKLDDFKTKIQQVAEALRPLGTEMEKVSNGFSAFPTRIQRLIQSTDRIPSSNTRAAKSYTELYHQIKLSLGIVKTASSTIAGLTKQENEYIENINLFNASMRQYTDEAQEYAEKVGEIMGIDPGEWMRNQGIFMTLLTGFGVASDRAYVMSGQLTQLGYDLSSFFNISFAESMQKLQSGISGELEPLRRLGYDLSQAKLQSIAMSLGIDKNVASMNQAEKAQLRYYAILTQVTTAQGDMARTLESPTNQIRIFQSQLAQAGRAIGSIFIPALNTILPIGIAVAKIIRIIANEIAALAGFELPEVDYSGITDYSGSLAEDMDSAAESAKELKRTILGIDEINRMNGDNGTGSSNLSGLGDIDFKLPTYDFLEDAVESRVQQIVNDMREWLGITGEIDSWAELFDTRLGKILSAVGLIGAGFLTWKLGKGLVSGVQWLTQTLTGNLVLTVTGLTIEAVGAYDMGKNGAELKNILEAAIGAAVGTTGLTLMGFKLGGTAGGLIGLTLGLGITLVTGIIAYEKGKEAAGEERFWNSEFGKYLAEVKKKIEGSSELSLEIKTKTTLRYQELREIDTAAESYKKFADQLYALIDLENKTPEDLVKIKSLIQILNDSGSLGEIELKYDEVADQISKAKDEVYNLIDAWKEQARAEAVLESLKESYKDLFDQQANLKMLEEQGSEFDRQLKSLYEQAGISMEEWSNAKEAFELASDAIGGKAGYWYQKLIGHNNELIAKYEETKQELDRCTQANRDYESQIEHLRDEVIPSNNNALNTARDTLKDLETQIDYLADTTGETAAIMETEFGKLPSAAKSAADGIQIAFSPLFGILDDLIAKNRELRSGMSEQFTNTYPGMLNSGGGSGRRTVGITVPMYASGGTPTTGQLFIAREQGAELVGNIGGKTAVMNNDQIVRSVSIGVRDANAEQNALLREQNALLRQIAAKDPAVSAVISTSDIVAGLERKNRREGRTVVAVNK